MKRKLYSVKYIEGLKTQNKNLKIALKSADDFRDIIINEAFGLAKDHELMEELEERIEAAAQHIDGLVDEEEI